MNIEQLQDNWEQVKGQVKGKFEKLTSDDISSIHGKKDKFIAKLKERYGYAKEKAETEITAFVKNCQCSPQNKSPFPQKKAAASSRV
jgi:uncharacterized protein YjbJ (UPF0337 family)